jgi:uncharacterized membrane protein
VTTWERRRLEGVDAARGIALLGMVAVHIVPAVSANGEVSLAFTLFAGRSSATFALLAGVGLALLTRSAMVGARRDRARQSVAVVTRAVLLVLLGLALGIPDSDVAVILVYYGALFLLAVPFLWLSARTLAALAAAWAVVAPLLSQLIRQVAPAPSYAVPTLEFFERPLTHSLSEILLTGYYPTLTWLTYLLAGLAVGRLPLRSPRVARALLVGGLALAVAARAVSWLLLHLLDGLRALRADRSTLFGAPLETALDTGLSGTTPTTTWWWLAVATPHSGTPLDLAQTAGAAVAVLGLCLLVLQRHRWWAQPLVAVGGMSLTLYCLHVVLLDDVLPRTMPYAFWWHALVLIAAALGWRRFVGQGPLEYVTQRLSRAVALAVVPAQDDRSRTRQDSSGATPTG